MKTIILIVLIAILFSSCITMVSDEKLNNWALENEYIRADNCPELVIPERTALPHPLVPTFETTDEEGVPIPITQRYLMTMVIQLFGTVEKFQYLVEIYEREYLNTDGKIMPNLTLEELKKLYEERLSTIEKAREEMQHDEPVGTPILEGTSDGINPYLTDSASPSDQLTVDQFEQLLELWNHINSPTVQLLDLTDLYLNEVEKADTQNE